jgi:hypothetical protein
VDRAKYIVKARPNVPPGQANYVGMHRHNCHTQYIAIGTDPGLTDGALHKDFSSRI